MRKSSLNFVLLCISISVQASDLVVFNWVWGENPASPINLSNRLDAPAGSDGFVKIEDGRFVKPNGQRLKIWGIEVQ